MPTRTVTVSASGSVQTVTLTGLGRHPFRTLEVVKLDNTAELWVGLENRAFTAANDPDVDVIPAGAQDGVFSVPQGPGNWGPTSDTGTDVELPVLYVAGGRVQFRTRD